MSSVFSKRDGYTRLSRTDTILEEDVRLLDDDEPTDQQPTFDFRGNEIMEAEPGTSADTSGGNGSVICDIPDENGRIEFLDLHEPMSRQFSLTEHHTNVETEENLKCVVSSLLFVAIVVTVLVVAFLINPSI